jgi:hypothetical protein
MHAQNVLTQITIKFTMTTYFTLKRTLFIPSNGERVYIYPRYYLHPATRKASTSYILDIYTVIPGNEERVYLNMYILDIIYNYTHGIQFKISRKLHDPCLRWSKPDFAVHISYCAIHIKKLNIKGRELWTYTVYMWNP